MFRKAQAVNMHYLLSIFIMQFVGTQLQDLENLVRTYENSNAFKVAAK